MIILIVGDFGVGKDTVANMIVSHLDNTQKILSYTTRKPRYDGEDTHIFVDDFNDNNVLAHTQIGEHHYWTKKSQFDKTKYNIYVVDSLGVKDVIDAEFDDIFIIEIVRPKWLIDVDKERLERPRLFTFNYSAFVDYRIINDKSLSDLEKTVQDMIQTHIVKE